MNSHIKDDDALYLEKSVRGLLEGLIFNIIKQKPVCSIKFMIDWLKNYIGEGKSNINNSELEELIALRREIKAYMKKYPNMHIEEEINSDKEDNDANDNQNRNKDKVEDIEINKTIQRISVSAEVYGIYHKREEYVSKVI